MSLGEIEGQDWHRKRQHEPRRRSIKKEHSKLRGIIHKLLPLGESDDLPVLTHFKKLIHECDPAAAIIDKFDT